ncbi:hypothetical protein TGME49_224275 [Toxoplasma gondii ME49]|uniref:Uncharacterized protein n=4 Tax=Toxoplasma gondii TaxID=5811 RepID=A0A2G8Y9A4_TOXGO|nr:hypothetical protein TGME49_224275 [Toxoplasma gondii ME49]EPT26938.1 hypothetical protein TGME49_224275 [Toxoplasma gondii ME49]KFG45710.1 hypothetical protein TGDOM2_224275 [Toxoplasma gondii GAB2-2007-GAL-DOM2]KYF42170.1 hypothetical protein TGARI_224275 [Toxoplasma gondii ARI]PIM03850.1 hypothetical protein TGCOUG_224275 [Toxoplasma gondii COUG]|eukprot:XP_018635936.1 hypothetical protein TGME49_224275 [Toxoplasma gondii ME49]
MCLAASGAGNDKNLTSSKAVEEIISKSKLHYFLGPSKTNRISFFRRPWRQAETPSQHKRQEKLPVAFHSCWKTLNLPVPLCLKTVLLCITVTNNVRKGWCAQGPILILFNGAGWVLSIQRKGIYLGHKRHCVTAHTVRLYLSPLTNPNETAEA